MTRFRRGNNGNGKHLPAIKHGAWSSHVRARYTDKRSREGKALAVVMKSLSDDLGEVTPGQRILLDRVKEKLIVLGQIGSYVDSQPSIIDKEGVLLPCLGRNYTSFSEALRRDIVDLYALAHKREKPPDLQDYLNGVYGKNREKPNDAKEDTHGTKEGTDGIGPEAGC